MYTDVSDASAPLHHHHHHPSPPPSPYSICSPLCFSSGKQNAVGRGREEAADESAKLDERLDDDKCEGSDIGAP